MSYLFHLVDDSFLLSQTFYLLEQSSATRFFVFFDGELGNYLLFKKKGYRDTIVGLQKLFILLYGKK